MGFRKDAYCKVWSVDRRERFSKVRLSVSRKNKDTGEYDQEFSGFCMFIGEAHNKANSLKEGDRIKLGDVDVTTTYDKAANKEYVNYKVFSYSNEDSFSGSTVQNRGSIDGNPVDGDTEEMPF